jgi:general secretion pathway protein L
MQLTSTTATRPLGRIRLAFDALVAELAAHRVLARDPATTLRIGPAATEVIKSGAPLHKLEGKPVEAVRRLVAQHAGFAKDCALGVEPGLSVTNRMVLPAESYDVLSAIVRNKVESIAPWPLPECLFGFGVSAIAGDSGHVAVDVAVVGRAQLEEIARTLAAAGIPVRAVRAMLPAGGSVEIDFHAEDRIRQGRDRARRLAAGVTLAAVLIAAYGSFLLWRSSQELSAGRQKMDSLIEDLRSAGAAKGATPLLTAANGLQERRRQRPSAAAVLNELSSLLPETAWLQSVSLDGTQLELKGEGSDIPPLIGILEESAWFSDVNFAAATQFNAERNAVAFAIGASLQQATGGEAGQ